MISDLCVILILAADLFLCVCHFTRSEQTSDDGLLTAPSQKVIESNSFPLIHNPLEDQVQEAITWSAIFRPTDSRVLSEAVAS